MRIYDRIWETGKARELSPAHHYKQQYEQAIQSIVVPAGEMVTFYEKPDRSGKKSFTFYEGTYHHLAWYDIDKYPGMVHIEKTDLRWTDLVEIGHYLPFNNGKDKFYKFHKIPIGDWTAPEYFWDDRISHLQIPYGVCVEVFDDKTQDNSLIFDGVNENGRTHIGLPDYGYGWKASRLRVTADAWVATGVFLENEKFLDGGEWEAESIHVTNDDGVKTTVPVSITADVSDTTEITWNVFAQISAKAEFEFGPETAHGTVGVEATVGGGYGQNESKTHTRSVTRGAQVELEGAGKADCSLMVRQGKMEADIVRTWRNKRTRAISETRGKIVVKKSGETRVSTRFESFATEA